jgi:hypothetical protein
MTWDKEIFPSEPIEIERKDIEMMHSYEVLDVTRRNDACRFLP